MRVGLWVDIQDLIMYATFWVWAWQGVKFPVSPLTSVVALTTLSHIALPDIIIFIHSK